MLEKDYRSFIVHLFLIVGIYNLFIGILQLTQLFLDGQILNSNTNTLIAILVTIITWSKFKKYIEIN